METIRSHHALYIIREGTNVIGFSGTCVDELIRAGTKTFCKISFKTNQRFDMGKNIEIPCTLNEFMIT